MKAVLPAGRTGTVGMLLAAATFAVSVACTSSSDSDGGESASLCAFLVDYKNRTYSDVANVDFTVGDKLGPATLPPCDDTPNDDDDGRTTPSSITAYAVEGLDPSIAIAVGDEPGDARLVVVYSGKEIPPEVKKLIQSS
ncbi:DUF6281 family protein [Streptomyces avermitilis]|uniref:DUF6281 family protein n=1 Tax=Streptomyces avermitilis TaxID=33903 RepID=UPI0033B229EF